jgi:hypothetical protein
MKKIKFLALMMMAGALVFTSCKKDDETIPAPTISLSGSDNQELDFTNQDSLQVVMSVSVKADGKVETFSIKEKKVVDANNSTSTAYDASTTDDFKGETSKTYYFDKWFHQSDFVGLQSINYEFNLTDKEGQSASKVLVIKEKQNSQETPFATEKTTGSFWHIHGQKPGAYDLDGDAEVSSTGDPSTKSMINTDPATDASVPSGFTGSWESGNNTEFVKDNNYDYDNATVEGATAAYAAGTASGTVTNPAVGDIYIAKKGNIYYVIKITSLNPEEDDNAKNNNGQIKFSYKKN